jgi:hypothetical protein
MSARPETTQILLPDAQVVTQGNGKQVPGVTRTTSLRLTSSENHGVLFTITRSSLSCFAHRYSREPTVFGPRIFT